MYMAMTVPTNTLIINKLKISRSHLPSAFVSVEMEVNAGGISARTEDDLSAKRQRKHREKIEQRPPVQHVQRACDIVLPVLESQPMSQARLLAREFRVLLLAVYQFFPAKRVRGEKKTCHLPSCCGPVAPNSRPHTDTAQATRVAHRVL
jgi:hypothetical protein